MIRVVTNGDGRIDEELLLWIGYGTRTPSLDGGRRDRARQHWQSGREHDTRDCRYHHRQGVRACVRASGISCHVVDTDTCVRVVAGARVNVTDRVPTIAIG